VVTQVHNKSNLLLICYNPILSVRNSNKLEPNPLHDRTNRYLFATILSYLLGTLTYLFYFNNIVVNLYK
jgi:hypothetical protein